MKKKTQKVVETKAKIEISPYPGQRYETTNLYIAVWLQMNGKSLVDINKSNPTRAVFIFEDFPGRNQLVNEFYQSELIQKFIANMQDTKAKLYSDNPPVKH
jgi:hypothetical protein